MDSDLRAVLNKIKWDENCDLSLLRVSYIDRGRPRDIGIVIGTDIVDIKQNFFELNDKMIPFHRIIMIRYDDKVLFSR